MNKQIFTAILRCNETKTFVRIEPFNCTFTHFLYSWLLVEEKNYIRIHQFEYKAKISGKHTFRSGWRRQYTVLWSRLLAGQCSWSKAR